MTPQLLLHERNYHRECVVTIKEIKSPALSLIEFIGVTLANKTIQVSGAQFHIKGYIFFCI